MEELGHADPRRVGPYELMGTLGSGGMGRVYLGRSAAGALAAVKVVHPDLARDPEFRRRFQREVAATVAVSGPHVAAIVHADTEAEPPWLATEYVAGPSLQARVVGDGPLPPAEVAWLGVRLATGLATIHAAGLVHRDVKPSNILLAADGPKLIDFGIARDTADSRLTRTGMAVGTPLFMAPEQIEGEADAGPAADVFALAGTLVYAATSGYPFGEGT
ncbi:MAG: serine/threonine protein kinase, partial [Catenulispora sp.]|nr:serine/threonine protein kinase [Catenulispora sp.]